MLTIFTIFCILLWLIGVAACYALDWALTPPEGNGENRAERLKTALIYWFWPISWVFLFLPSKKNKTIPNSINLEDYSP
jgi:hypothetical protein